MQRTWIIVILIIASSCHKSAVPDGNHCLTVIKASDKVSVCLERVLNDSRCPPDVTCVWQGYALSRFRFSKNGQSTPIELSTIRHPGIPSPDTTLQGYHVELISLGRITNGSLPKAEIRITAQ